MAVFTPHSILIIEEIGTRSVGQSLSHLEIYCGLVFLLRDTVLH
jgi:hypothetical protein